MDVSCGSLKVRGFFLEYIRKLYGSEAPRDGGSQSSCWGRRSRTPDTNGSFSDCGWTEIGRARVSAWELHFQMFRSPARCARGGERSTLMQHG